MLENDDSEILINITVPKDTRKETFESIENPNFEKKSKGFLKPKTRTLGSWKTLFSKLKTS